MAIHLGNPARAKFQRNCIAVNQGGIKMNEEHEAKDIEEHETKDIEKQAEESKKYNKKKYITVTPMHMLIAVAVLVILFNQYQISVVSGMMDSGFGGAAIYGATSLSGDKELSNINLAELKSTAHTIAAVFPVEDIQTAEDAMAIMFPTGTPEYGEDLGVSFDDPIGSLSVTSKMYNGLRSEVQQNNPEGWQRFLNLATKPVGISCEFCCGVGAVGTGKNGNPLCGCKHQPALMTIALYLSAYTDYNDGELLREVMRWKTLWFPKNMIGLGASLAGGDTSALDNLPGMVGGC